MWKEIYEAIAGLALNLIGWGVTTEFPQFQHWGLLAILGGTLLLLYSLFGILFKRLGWSFHRSRKLPFLRLAIPLERASIKLFKKFPEDLKSLSTAAYDLGMTGRTYSNTHGIMQKLPDIRWAIIARDNPDFTIIDAEAAFKSEIKVYADDLGSRIKEKTGYVTR